MAKIKTKCCICGKEIYRWPYQIRQSDVCCSKACLYAHNSGRISATRANLINKKYGMLTVLEFAGTRKGHALWKCRCDCGNETFVTTGLLNYGATRSCGCLSRRRGSDHPNYRKGFNVTPHGYKEIPITGSTSAHRYKSEHRTIVENMLGRKLKSNEVIHHINQNKLDNRPENLVVMTRSEHAALHAKIRRETNNAKD